MKDKEYRRPTDNEIAKLAGQVEYICQAIIDEFEEKNYPASIVISVIISLYCRMTDALEFPEDVIEYHFEIIKKYAKKTRELDGKTKVEETESGK